ncbi:hypothetical protein DYH10_02050 [Candidatus Saccharibacteria bacterium CPR2]|nr:hypothetical protein [Candidatus Saccharibacteria bacterium CPR2]
MPARNIEKIYASEVYYHLYNRGVEKRDIFMDDEDYRVFLNLLKRYLGVEKFIDKFGREYPNYHERIDLISYSLMPNHYHLLLWVNDDMAMTDLLRSLATAYSMYFNKKYKRVGKLFQDRFKASMIRSEEYLWHITRYIHLNSEDIGKKFNEYKYSSYKYYEGKAQAEWVKPGVIIDMFKEANQDYKKFHEDYIDYRNSLKFIDLTE